MSDLDVRTKNILTALENFLTDSKKHIDSQTHEEIVNVLIKHTTRVLEDYRNYQDGRLPTSDYKRSLTRLAEIVCLGIRRLPG